MTKAWLLAEGPAREPTNARKVVTFTFDDGPFPETTPSILRTLSQYGVKATFFFIGKYLDGDSPRAVATRQVAREVEVAGHLIGNHTHDHSLLMNVPDDKVREQIEDGARSIERALGYKPTLFRPPYGQLNDFGRKLIAESGQELVLWNVEVGDMVADEPNLMFESLKGQLDYAGGGVVLLHDIRPQTTIVIARLLEWIAAHPYDPTRPNEPGYSVVDLPEYFRQTASAPQPYGSRTELEAARGKAWQANKWKRAKRSA